MRNVFRQGDGIILCLKIFLCQAHVVSMINSINISHWIRNRLDNAFETTLTLQEAVHG
jgi:hypothetical protein